MKPEERASRPGKNVFVIIAEPLNDGEDWNSTGFHCESALIGSNDNGSFGVQCLFWTNQQWQAADKAIGRLGHCLSVPHIADVTGFNGRRMVLAEISASKPLVIRIRPALEAGEIHPVTGKLVPPCGVFNN
jgi:hypothetical protein